VIADIVSALRCPHCGEDLHIESTTLRCARDHSFDIAHQGYANLTLGGRNLHSGDSAAMIAARDAFIAAGHLAGLRETIAEAAAGIVAATGPSLLVDAGAGTGYYLAGVLDRLPDYKGVALDASKFALRRAARAHVRMGAIGCDIWNGLPLADGCAALVLDIFAPRNGSEFRRILATSGRLIVVTPTPDHLRELVAPLGLLTVDPQKPERLEAGLSSGFTLLESTVREWSLVLESEALAALVGMGPSARHLDADELQTRIAHLLGEETRNLRVTASVALSVYASA
jgi:23S rRNA (guanine745-N1)-methyltransferase